MGQVKSVRLDIIVISSHLLFYADPTILLDIASEVLKESSLVAGLTLRASISFSFLSESAELQRHFLSNQGL